MKFIVTAAVGYSVYLLLTIGSGDAGLWSREELIVGAVFAVLAGALLRNRFIGKDLRMLNPKRWFTFLVYLFPFFFAMAKANIDVAYRVITGRINPAIVKINPNLKNDMSLTLLANSITLTPGTLSVDVDQKTNELYVHWINVDPEVLKDMPRDYHPICGSFPDWAKRIAG
ncbi:MAG: Na+/H+ antiporter subunit E [Dehalococcoidia bacterium]|nr:Na+/H+ antiporter subunit E [Dehalococcoidia bacterium]MDH4367634.1 Na+/H+ antiporter subunit E [Dehalococcoidia bacterium]